jgi:hypothetical protein
MLHSQPFTCFIPRPISGECFIPRPQTEHVCVSCKVVFRDGSLGVRATGWSAAAGGLTRRGSLPWSRGLLLLQLHTLLLRILLCHRRCYHKKDTETDRQRDSAAQSSHVMVKQSRYCQQRSHTHACGDGLMADRVRYATWSRAGKWQHGAERDIDLAMEPERDIDLAMELGR